MTDDSATFKVKDYTIKKLQETCPVAGCLLKCSECRICSHMYHCNCPDYLVNRLGCKHMHLIQRFINGESKHLEL